MGILKKLLAPAKKDLFVPETDKADIAVAVPFGMDRKGIEASFQGLVITYNAVDLVLKGQVQRVVALGGNRATPDSPSEGEWAAQTCLERGCSKGQVFSENLSENTHENAVEFFCLVNEMPLLELTPVMADLTQQKIVTAVLVAQELHARRALAVFRKEAEKQNRPITFRVLPVDAGSWLDNTKLTLCHPLLFAIREIFLAWPFFKLKGWV